MDNNIMVLGENLVVSLDTRKTQLNNNVLVVGASGAGKTRGIVIPNILMGTGSYLITDPKGNLYDKYGKLLEDKGYVVKKLDFTNPAESAHYNFMEYIRSTHDIVKAAHMLIYQRKSGGHADPFWDEASQLLLQAAIGYLWEMEDENYRNYGKLMDLLEMLKAPGENDSSAETEFDRLMKSHGFRHKDSYAVSCYNKFRVAAARTLRSIMISVNARLGLFDTPDLCEMMKTDDIDIPSIGKRKTALFVVVSDTDRSLDGLVNIFFTQAMSELCRYADNECEDSRLPVPVRFIMDDFATNCCIDEFPRMISSIRSRDISTMLMIQAESQLEEYYNKDSKTIIANCDTYVYMGGNDIATAEEISKRCDQPLKKILYMPVGTSWVFRRGQMPVNVRNYKLRGPERKKAILLDRAG